VSTFGVPADAIGLAPDPTQTTVWTVEESGNVQQTSLQSTKPIQQFALGSPGIALAIAPNSGTLYVLKGNQAASNIDLISTATDTVDRVIGAAANSVGLVASISGTTLYDVVGSPTLGNIQAISLAPGA
jgi:DNA-binding beta-propeller fold protein YncE